jgi:putative aminopeptidase FrvX
MSIPSVARELHHRWLLELTQLPTAAGKEQRVIAWIKRWVSERPALLLSQDSSGNLHIANPSWSTLGGPPVYFTAHMDHPAFTVVNVSETSAELGFRGGVMDDYFNDARVTIHTEDAGPVGAILTGRTNVSSPFPLYRAELDSAVPGVRVGDIATWELPEAHIQHGNIYTHACDDLAALAAALAAYDTLLTTSPAPGHDVRLIFTRAEEIGFIGAIGACRDKTIEPGSRVLALENSRSFDDSPIGGGPIVRVGDRLSIFTPSLTAAVARRAEEIAGGASTPTASQKLSQAPAWKWQRKLMAGGACEATVFCTYGYEATCICLPLGNYHNMADLTSVQAGTNTSPPRVGPEFVSIADFDGLVDLLAACGRKLESAPTYQNRIDKLWADHADVLRD